MLSLRLHVVCAVVPALLWLTPTASAQDVAVTTTPVSIVPHVIRYSGTLPDAPSSASVVDVTFSLYENQTGGDPLWTEKQTVALDPTSKYTVLLGSQTQLGLPHDIFASGQARWLGVTLAGQPESPRTILVATPYSLKASDAETVGGHPASDFKLAPKDADGKPETVTDISQLTDGGGLVFTNGGTGPTVAISLDQTYLVGLGNNVYAQLGGTNKLTGTNTFTGKNTFTAGDLLLGTSPVLSAANVLGTNGVTATPSGNTVTLSLNDTTLISLGNTTYAQIAAPNTFTKTQTFSVPAVFASSQTFPGAITVGANNAFTGNNTFAGTSTFNGQVNTVGITATGLYSFNANLDDNAPVNVSNNSVNSSTGLAGSAYTTGLYAQATDTTAGDQAIGVIGITYNAGIGGLGVQGWAEGAGASVGVQGVYNGGSNEGAAYRATAGAGVWADSNTTQVGESLLATADDNTAGVFINTSENNTIPLVAYAADPAVGGTSPFWAGNLGTGGYCYIDSGGNMNCTGVFFQLAAIRQDRKVRTFGMMSAESWTEDAGFGQLSGGSAHVEIDPTFAEAANTGVDYHVFITPEGETGQLYVTHKTATGFDVREAKGGKSTAQFSYRIMAKQHGMEQARLTDVTEREAKVNAKLAAGRPTLEQMRKAKPMAMPRRPPLPAKPVEAEHAALAR